VVLGWITGKAIDDRIAALIAEMDSIDKGITSGEFTFHGAFGWTKILHYRNQAAAQRAELVRIKEVIAKGEYALEIPGLGRLTRKDVERLLSEVDAEIVAIKASAGAGGFQIHRPAVGFVTRDGLTKALDDAETSFRTMQALVSDGLFTVHITGAGGGFLKRQEIEQKIADFDKQIADITTAIRAGDYKAQVLGGWMSRNEIGLYIEDREKRLGDPNLAQIQRNQIAEQIEAAHKALTEWRDLSAVDLVIKTSEKTTYMAWLGWVMKLAKPDFDHRALKRDEMTYHVASFDGELRLRLAPLEARRDALMSARVWFAAD
jgi:hypothetical protein